MAFPGELRGIEGTTCDGCGTDLPLKVLSTRAGHYLGYWCPNCGPYSRETGYMSLDAAERLLGEMAAGKTAGKNLRKAM